jgi:hypothetical protein
MSAGDGVSKSSDKVPDVSLPSALRTYAWVTNPAPERPTGRRVESPE